MNAQQIIVTCNVVMAAGVVFVIPQIVLALMKLRTQQRAIELGVTNSMQAQFLEISSCFSEKINDPNTKLADLTAEERRALDRYFYFCSNEYQFIEEGIVSSKTAKTWIAGMESAAKRPPFVERWRQIAHTFNLHRSFKELFIEAIAKNPPQKQLPQRIKSTP